MLHVPTKTTKLLHRPAAQDWTSRLIGNALTSAGLHYILRFEQDETAIDLNAIFHPTTGVLLQHWTTPTPTSDPVVAEAAIHAWNWTASLVECSAPTTRFPAD
ncbi:MAG: hypothetical protein ABL901_05385 [Hyphomicrobiaceae bacterium]